MLDYYDRMEKAKKKWLKKYSTDEAIKELDHFVKLLDGQDVHLDSTYLYALQEQAIFFGNIFDKFNSENCNECGNSNEFGIGACCRNCVRYRGHFDMHRQQYHVTHKILRRYEILYGFDPKTYGYLDPEKKICKLPRILRSSTCLGYKCEKLNQTLTWKNVEHIHRSVNIMKAIRNMWKIPY